LVYFVVIYMLNQEKYGNPGSVRWTFRISKIILVTIKISYSAFQETCLVKWFRWFV
jgi:hypothetical protein